MAEERAAAEVPRPPEALVVPDDFREIVGYKKDSRWFVRGNYFYVACRTRGSSTTMRCCEERCRVHWIMRAGQAGPLIGGLHNHHETPWVPHRNAMFRELKRRASVEHTALNTIYEEVAGRYPDAAGHLLYERVLPSMRKWRRSAQLAVPHTLRDNAVALTDHLELDTVGDVDPDIVSLASDEEAEESLPDICEYICNKCEKGIINCRLVCVQCSDWDLCGACAARGEHPHHYLLRVPQGAEPEEVQRLLTLIRSNLRDNSEEDQSQAATVPQTSDPETAIKIEVQEEPTDYEDPLHDTTVIYMDTQELQPLRLATLSKTLDTIESEAAKKPPTKRTQWVCEYAPPPFSSTKKIKTSQEETLETLKSNVVIIRKDKPAPLTTDKKSKIQVSQNVERAETFKVRKALPTKQIKTYTLTSNVKDTNKPEEVSSEMSDLLLSIEPDKEKISQEEELTMAVENLSNAFGDVTSQAEGEKNEEIRAAERLKDSVHLDERHSEAGQKKLLRVRVVL